MFASIRLERRLKESKMGQGCWGAGPLPLSPISSKALSHRKNEVKAVIWMRLSGRKKKKRSQPLHPHSLVSVGTSWRWKFRSPSCSRPYSKPPPPPGLKAQRSVVPLIMLLMKRKTLPIPPSSQFSKRAKDTLGVKKQTRFKKLLTLCCDTKTML